MERVGGGEGGMVTTENPKNENLKTENFEKENLNSEGDIDPSRDKIFRLTNGEIESIQHEEKIEMKQRQGRPLFLCCESLCKGKAHSISLQVDSGADRCIISRSEAIRLDLKIRRFNRKQFIIGVEGKNIACSDFVVLKLKIWDNNSKAFIINILAYIFEKDMPNLLGSDVLSYMGAIICYKNETLTLDGHCIQLQSQWKRAKDESREEKKVVFYSKVGISLPARACRQIAVELSDPAGVPDSVFALIGDHAGDVSVIDSVWDGRKPCYKMAILNLSDSPKTLLEGEYLGYVLTEEQGNEIISLDSLLADRQFFVKEEKSEVGGENLTLSEGVQISDRKRMNASELDNFYDVGCEIQLPKQELREPPFQELEKIDKEVELERNRHSKMWTDKKDFLAMFKWEEMKKELNEDVGELESANFTEKLQNLFWSYRDVFWDGDWGNFKQARVKELEIEVVDKARPAVDKFRAMSEDKQKILKSFMDDLIRAKVISRSNGLTPFTANPHIVRERRETNEGYIFKYRYTIDYRNQNKLCKSIGYKLPLMEELLREASSKGRFFMSFDLSSYFFQLPISERSKQITSFYLLNEGIYQWNRIPMGMKNAPGLAQLTTDYVAKHVRNVLGYIDDYFLYALNLEEMYLSAESFLLAMSHFNLLLGPKKVNLTSKKRNFLGYSISQNSIIRVTPNKVTDLRDLKSPTTKDELRSILGLLSWYAHRAKLRDITRGMRELCKSGNRFRWSEDLEKDLRESIEILLCPETGCLRPAKAPSEECPFVIFSDSSRHAFGGVLAQFQRVSEIEIREEKLQPEECRLYLIEYFAKSIPPNQLLTPISLLELESLYLCLKHWKSYVMGGVRVICYTDSRFVSYWTSLELCSEKVARQLQFISEFNIEVRFLMSELNQSDVISRSINKSCGQPTAANPFASINIRNAEGTILKPHQVFSEDKRREMNLYFNKHKRGPLARILNLAVWRTEMETSPKLGSSGSGGLVGPPYPSRTSAPGNRRPGRWPARALQSEGQGRLMRCSLIKAARLGGELDRRFGSLPTTEAKLGSPGLGGPKEASGEGPRPGPGAGRHGPNPKGLGGRQKANSVGGHGVERKEMSEEEEDQGGKEASGKGPEPGLGAGRHKPNGE